MVLTQLEARVAPEQWEVLKQSYHNTTRQVPSTIYQTYLVQDGTDKELWRILTVWHSHQALQEYRASVDTPAGVLMFREAGAEPTLSIFDVIDHASGD
jgi:quinol monooxygenase YgiN